VSGEGEKKERQLPFRGWCFLMNTAHRFLLSPGKRNPEVFFFLPLERVGQLYETLISFGLVLRCPAKV